jgi:hypothetical protein
MLHDSAPLFSVVVPVYRQWDVVPALLAHQRVPPLFA